ncbi:unnamed protein product, partial [Meganyctiphanes norvegica]
ADSTILQKFIDKIGIEEFGKEEQKEAVALEIRGISLVRKIAIAASNVKESIETKSKVAGKLAKLDLPTFDGDFLLYKYFRTRFITLTEGYNETTKKIYLTNSLTGRARKYVEDLIIHDGEYEEIWKQLNSHFGNPNNIIDATLKAFFELPRPSKDIQEIEEHFIQSKNRCTSVIALDHNPDELLAAVYMLQLPGEVRSELEKKLHETGNRESETKYTFNDLGPLMEEYIRIMKLSSQKNEELEKISNPIKINAMVGITRTVNKNAQEKEIVQQLNLRSPNINPQNQINIKNPIQTHNLVEQSQPPIQQEYYCNFNRSYNNSKYNIDRTYDRGDNVRGRERPYSHTGWSSMYPNCPLCDKQHLINHCMETKHGPEMREKLKSLDRCDACLVTKDQHDTSCIEIKEPCRYCKNKGHYHITCDGKIHPGSWLIKEELAAVTETTSVLQCMTNLEIPIISENSISTSRNSSQGDFSLSGVIAIDLSTKDNRNFRARTILDSGSGTNFISKEILPYIRYDKLDSEGLVVTGINDTKASTHDLVRIYLVSKECQQKSIKCYVMPEMINYD